VSESIFLDYVKNVRLNDRDYYQKLKMADTIYPPDKPHLLPLRTNFTNVG